MAKLEKAEMSKHGFKYAKMLLEAIESKKKVKVTIGTLQEVVIDPIFAKPLSECIKRNNFEVFYGRTPTLVYGKKVGGSKVEFKMKEIDKGQFSKAPVGGAGVGDELIQVNSINRQLEEIKKRDKTTTVKIRTWVNGKAVIDEVVGAIQTRSNCPKSDIHFLHPYDSDRESLDTLAKAKSDTCCCFVSYKKGRSVKDFQGWGGASETREKEIFQQSATKLFTDLLRKYFGNGGLPRATTVMFDLNQTNNGKKVALMSIYGNQFFNHKASDQNVNIVLQGDIKIVKSGQYYELTAVNVHHNGELPTSETDRTVFLAIHKPDRSNLGIKACRVNISPKGARRITHEFQKVRGDGSKVEDYILWNLVTNKEEISF